MKNRGNVMGNVMKNGVFR